MASKRQGLWRPLLGLGFAIAGADKLLAIGGYPRLFRNWGWSPEAMRGIGAGEFIGGVLVACPPAHRLGALLLTLASSAVLTAELRRGETERALPRATLLFAAALAALPARAARKS